MTFFGVYHTDYARSHGGVFDTPCITKGRMTLCADGAASRDSVLAMTAGRIRNRAALQSALGCDGGAGDATLVMEAWRRWGEEYPTHVEGPVVTAVMDVDADALVLSRDRMGERPVFYTLSGGGASFSDHPDALLKAARAEPVVDADGLRELFGLGPARSPGRTLYRDIMALEPGCALVVRGESARVARYYRIEDVPFGDDARTAISRVRELLEQAVDDVAPLTGAVMLSGGLDSTALTALLARRVSPLRSFSVDYRDSAADFRANAFRRELDGPYIDEAVRAFGTQHRAVVLDQEALAAGLARAVSLRGFPGMADIDVSLMLLSERIAVFDRRVVSGECGDEVFGGYPWFKGDAPLDGFPWSGSLALRERLMLPEVGGQLRLTEYVGDVFHTWRDRADPGAAFPARERRLRTMQRLCFAFFMTNLQERAVRMGEGAGIEILTPLCDERLAEYVYNVPWEIKFTEGQEKGLFRQAVADLLPERLLRRVKSPYPKTCSPVFAQLMRRMALDMVADADAPIFALVDRRRVRALAHSDLDPADTPWFGQLMAGPQLLGHLWQINRWMEERDVRIAM